ncbi:MAG: hypothetical protein AB8H80_15105, partial [Planctomycetota bacterium]
MSSNTAFTVRLSLVALTALVAAPSDTRCQEVSLPFLAIGSERRQGPFSTSSAAIGLDAATRALLTASGAPADALFLKPANGQSDTPDVFDPVDGIPNYSPTSFLPANVVSAMNGMNVVNALSLDNTPVFDITPLGVAEVQQGFWAAMLASVTAGSAAEANSNFHTSSNQGAVVASYILADSNNLDARLPGRTFEEFSSSDFYPAGSNVEISYMDHGIGIVANNPSLASSSVFINDHKRLFFSISKTWLNAPGNASLIWAEDTAGNAVAGNAATIYTTTWTEDPTLPYGGMWSTPVEFLTPSQLNLNANDDVDALAVSTLPAGAPGAQVIYSAQLHATPSQLMVKVGNNPAMPLRTREGDLMETKLGVDSEGADIDAICPRDPEAPTGDRYHTQFVGAPTPSVLLQQLHAAGLVAMDAGISIARSEEMVPDPSPNAIAGAQITMLHFNLEVSAPIFASQTWVQLGLKLNGEDIVLPAAPRDAGQRSFYS